jgi:serine/threonine protein kinase
MMSTQEKTMHSGDVLGGRYRIVAEGSPQDIGTLYKAYDSQCERLVAILLLAPRFGSGADAVERLLRSQQAVADLAVPALIPVDDVGAFDGQLYLVRNQVDGHLLADLLVRTGPLTSDAAVQITIHLCEALAPAHRAGLIHGSLSPYSVLIRDDGEVLVTDVGLLPALQTDPASSGRPWGRAPYLSPEQAAGETVHPAADVYVIGSLLYRMLAGRPPFQAQDEAVLAVRHLRQDPPLLEVLAPQVPPRLVEIVHKALAKEPAARYRNAGQMAHILRSQVLRPQIASQQPESAVSQRVPSRERLVVPAPSPAGVYEPAADFEDWSDEPGGVDWLMVALVIAALIAILGLIPLWRTVYQRYAVSPPAPSSSLYRPDQEAWAPGPFLLGEAQHGANARTKLDDFGLVWYNLLILDPLVPRPPIHDGAETDRGNRERSLGVKITGFRIEL